MIGVLTRKPSFSAIARSVMISAYANELNLAASRSFSAIARSVMISAAASTLRSVRLKSSFSAIARSVMISAVAVSTILQVHDAFQCYSS